MALFNDRGIRRIVLALFFLSGACGLVYEVVWMRMLTLVFGATAFATSAILSAFFAGLALGSRWFGKVADRSQHPLALYAALEWGIGLFAFLFPFLLSGLTAVYVAIARHAGLGFYALSLVRLVLAVLVLIVPATLMGGTVPVIVKFFVREKGRIGLSVGALYAINTFGAVAGALAAGFVLILFVGVRETAQLAAVVNLVVAVAAYAMSRSSGTAEHAEHAEGTEQPQLPRLPELPELPELPGQRERLERLKNDDARSAAIAAATDGDELSSGIARLVLWAIGLSGMAALALEVLWTRALVYFLDNSTHAFTTMLTAFLLGIAIGSAVVARYADRRMRLVTVFGVVEVLIGFSALLAIPILAASTPVLSGLEGTLDSAFLMKWIGLRFARSVTVMLVPTVLMGMTVPLVAKIHTPQLARVGRSLGNVYSANTIGGVIGSVVAGFVLIPLLGVGNGIVVAAALSVAIGIVLLLADPSVRLKRTSQAVIAASIVFVFAGVTRGTAHSLVLSSYRERADAAQVLFYKEGIGSTVKVFRDKQGEDAVSIDGFPVAGTSSGMRDAQESLGNFGLLLSNVPNPRVNLIGFGAGGASWESLQYDVPAVDCVELVPAVIDAARWFPSVNHGVLTLPRYNLIMGDGRNFALVSDRTYDVISVDATSPKMAGNGSLYSLEFYNLLRDRLSDDGLVVQWLPFHLLSAAELKMTARTFQQAFPHTTLWLSPLKYHGVLVGSKKKLQIDVGALRRKLERPGVRQEFAYAGGVQPLDFLAAFVMGEDDLRRFTGSGRLNTDDHPYLEFTPAWSYFVSRGYALQNLTEFQMARRSVAPLLVNAGDTPRAAALFADSVGRRYEATQHSFAGDILYSLGKSERAWSEWSAALTIDPADGSATRGVRRAEGRPE